MAKKYFAQDVKTSSEFTYKIKNIEMMKSAKSSKNPTLNYQLKGREFIRFWNYEIYLSLVKAYTDMKFVICDECKCKSQPPSSIIDGISSYPCFKFPRRITNDPCVKPPPCPPPCPPPPCPPCRPNNRGTMRPCRFKQTKPCVPRCRPCYPKVECEKPCEETIPVTICTNPLLKCYDPCNPCKKYKFKY